MSASERIQKIVTGGQSGVDRAGLDAALELGISVGGWCPKGRKAEDGLISERYPLIETESDEYIVRTEWNVRDSDATLILNLGLLEGGTKMTEVFAIKHHKPYLIIPLDELVEFDDIKSWLKENHVKVLNIAGPRESKRPGVYKLAKAFLNELLKQV